jgi:hypothetical protein
MSIVSAIESAFDKAKAEIEKWWGKEPDFATILTMGIAIVGVSLETVFTVDGNGPAATLVGAVVSKAQAEIAAVNTLVATVGTTPSVKSLLLGVATDISTLEAAANITDPKSVAAVTLAVNTLNSLVSSFPTTPVATTAA